MKNRFGPWATLMDAGRNPQLSAFWRRRLTRLPATARSGAALGWRAASMLAVASLALMALPTLRGRTVGTEPGGATPAETPGRAEAAPPAAAWPKLYKTLAAHRGIAYCVAFSRDGKILASSGNDGVIKLWEAATGKNIATWIAPKLSTMPDEEEIAIRSVALSPDGKMLAAGCTGTISGGTIRLWDVGSGKILATYNGLPNPNLRGRAGPYSLLYSPDGKGLITGSEDNLVRLWDVTTGKISATFPLDEDERGYSVALSSDGKLLAAGGSKGMVKVWDVASSRNTLTIAAGEPGNPASSVAFSPRGGVLASGCNMKGCQLWDTANGMLLATFIPDAADEALSTNVNNMTYCVTFSPDGRTLAQGCNNGLIRLMDVASRSKRAAFLAHTALVRCLAFSPDGHTLASASNDGTVRLWDLAAAAGASSAARATDPAELSYSGTVVDKTTGKPIAGATVTARRRNSGEHRVLGESHDKTDAAGKYTLTIPPQQVAERPPFIELDVSHPAYASRTVWKQEKTGGRPVFEPIELLPGEPIMGTVVTPDGRPAANVKVVACSMAGHDVNNLSYVPTETDQKGAFRVNMAQGGKGAFWILPKEYAPSTHVWLKKGGDLGRFVLQPGMRVPGRVVDEHGQPVNGVWVNARLVGGAAKQWYQIPVVDLLCRSGLTDSQGRFTLAPLPADEYVIDVEEQACDFLVEDRTARPVPGVFGPRMLTLKPEALASVEFRPMPEVVVECRFFDSHSMPRGGHPALYGHVPGTSEGVFFHTEGKPDRGGYILRAPRGLQHARLLLITDYRTALRVRMKQDGPLSNLTHHIDLGTLEGDLRGIQVVCFQSPLVLVKAVAADGGAIKNATLRFDYAQGRRPYYDWGGRSEGHDAGYRRQGDGRLRSENLLPDEEFTLSVLAAGYVTQSVKLNLPEGAVKELTVQLRRDASKVDY